MNFLKVLFPGSNVHLSCSESNTMQWTKFTFDRIFVAHCFIRQSSRFLWLSVVQAFIQEANKIIQKLWTSKLWSIKKIMVLDISIKELILVWFIFSGPLCNTSVLRPTHPHCVFLTLSNENGSHPPISGALHKFWYTMSHLFILPLHFAWLI